MRKMTVLLFVSILISVGLLSGCVKEAKDTDGDGFLDTEDDFPNDPNEWIDIDEDGVGNNTDAFPYDPTQWADRDGDSYGDNPIGFNPDEFPDDPNEWNDSDIDGVGDNSDIYDNGDAGIEQGITYFQSDGYPDEEGGIADVYFTMKIEVKNESDGEFETIGEIKSDIYLNHETISDNISITVDVKEDIVAFRANIVAMDYDSNSDDDIIDLRGDESRRTVIWTYIYDPQTTAYASYSDNGTLDSADEMDGYIEYYIKVVEV